MIKPFNPTTDPPQACAVCPECQQIFTGSSYQTHGNEAHGWDKRQEIQRELLRQIRQIQRDHPDLDVAKALEEAIDRDRNAQRKHEKEQP